MNKIMEQYVVIVTGSTRGIGYQIAESLAEQGASVIINCRRKRFKRKTYECY